MPDGMNDIERPTSFYFCRQRWEGRRKVECYGGSAWHIGRGPNVVLETAASPVIATRPAKSLPTSSRLPRKAPLLVTRDELRNFLID